MELKELQEHMRDAATGILMGMSQVPEGDRKSMAGTWFGIALCLNASQGQPEAISTLREYANANVNLNGKKGGGC